MSLLSGFDDTLPEIDLLGQASIAAFSGRPIPAGWNVITPQQLGVDSQFWDGNYFTNNGASAIVLQQGNTWIISFRGTDGLNDVAEYPELIPGTYINMFQPLLNAVALNAPAGTNFEFTGASLGGAATNEMADIAASQYGGKFASATFVAFESPVISTANGILNLGFENDPIYKVLDGYNDFSSTFDHLIVATSQYMSGNYDGLHPLDPYAHLVGFTYDAFAQLEKSVFLDQMNKDSIIIFDDFNGPVTDITPGLENMPAFYIGGPGGNDTIIGGPGGDHIEGFGGNNTLIGGAGNDVIVGGPGGNNTIDGGGGINAAGFFGPSKDYTIVVGPSSMTVEDKVGTDGTDTLTNIQNLLFTDTNLSATSFIEAATLPAAQLENLTEMYVAYFNRAPNAVGLDYWASRLVEGMTLQDIAKSFFEQPETVATYPPDMPVTDFVTQVYQNVLGRAPDTSGLDYWVQQLESGQLSKDVFMLAIIYGARAATGGAEDVQYLANKGFIGQHFALTDGLNDVGEAHAVMAAFNGTPQSVIAANQLSNSYLATASTAAGSELVVQLVGVAETSPSTAHNLHM
jgi:hypothetical protein